ncbi:hypothetical protein Tco_0698784 [Tanacetum coccineum]
MIRKYIICKRLCICVWDMHGEILEKRSREIQSLKFVVHDIPRDILRHNSLHEVLTSACHPSCRFVKRGCLFDRPASLSALSLFQEFGIDFCSESFEIFHQNGVIGIDVTSTGGNKGFWFGAILGIIREIEFQKDLVLEDFKSFVGSIV